VAAAGVARAKGARGSGVRGSDFGKAEANAGSATGEGEAVQDNDEQLHDVQDDGVQGSHARCGRSCSAAAAGGSTRE
jgi:hypothetical protein